MRFSLLFLLSLLTTLAFAQGNFTVKGKFKNYDGKVYLYTDQKDSVYTRNGEFEFHGAVKIPVESHISIPSKVQLEITTFWIDEGETFLELDTISFKDTRFSGLNLKANIIKAGNSHHIMDALFRQYNEIWATSLSETEKNKQMKATTDKLLLEHPNSVLSLNALSSMMKLYERDELEKLYASFSPTLQKTANGLKIKNKYIEVIDIVVGGRMPNFTQADQYGKSISLDEFKGKFVLIDFWASWCIPCREENPALLKAYNKFKSKGFDILSVSFDHKKDAWLKAIADDKLTWAHVSDLGGWQNVLAIRFKVKEVPSNYLVDPNGVVIAKDLHGEELSKKLAEIFEAK